ncbi:hypothetical protein ACFQ2M_40285 [Kitasatospora saccharophila]|uniref:hypothetical protein n=1 Tax=Kitasatospora saccharophila TaxID=407973 RepID=UPI0036448A27
MTCCTTLIGDYWNGKQREKYLALQAICSAVSATAFFALGGAAGSAGWRAPSGPTPSACSSPPCSPPCSAPPAAAPTTPRPRPWTPSGRCCAACWPPAP